MADGERLWTPEHPALQTPALITVREGARGFVVAPPGKEPVNEYFGEAILSLTERNEHVRKLINDNLGPRCPMPSTHAILLLCNSFKEGVLYPYPNDRFQITIAERPFSAFTSAREIEGFLEDYWAPGSYGHETTAWHLREHNVANTSPNRYALPMLIATILQQARPALLPEDLYAVDIGTGDMREIKRWVLRAHLTEGGPKPPEVTEPVRDSDGNISYQTNSDRTQRLLEVWQEVAPLAYGVGLDSMPTYLYEIQRWIHSSEYPSYYNNWTTFEQNAVYTDISPPRAQLAVGNILKPDHRQKIEAAAQKAGTTKKRPDLVTSITMLHEMIQARRPTALRHMTRLAIGGLVVAQDFLTVDANDPEKLVSNVRSFGEPYTYNTYVYKDGVPRLWFTSESGRVHRAQIGHEFGMVGNEQVLSPEDQKIFGVTAA